VAGLSHEIGEARAGLAGRGRQTRPQRVAGKQRRIEPSGARGLLDQAGDGLVGQRLQLGRAGCTAGHQQRPEQAGVEPQGAVRRPGGRGAGDWGALGMRAGVYDGFGAEGQIRVGPSY